MWPNKRRKIRRISVTSKSALGNRLWTHSFTAMAQVFLPNDFHPVLSLGKPEIENRTIFSLSNTHTVRKSSKHLLLLLPWSVFHFRQTFASPPTHAEYSHTSPSHDWIMASQGCLRHWTSSSTDHSCPWQLARRRIPPLINLGANELRTSVWLSFSLSLPLDCNLGNCTITRRSHTQSNNWTSVVLTTENGEFYSTAAPSKTTKVAQRK